MQALRDYRAKNLLIAQTFHFYMYSHRRWIYAFFIRCRKTLRTRKAQKNLLGVFRVFRVLKNLSQR